MNIKIKKLILKQIEAIFNDYNELRHQFDLDFMAQNAEEQAGIHGIITKIKVLIVKYFGESSLYYREIDKYSVKLNGTDLKLIMADLKVLYDNVKKDYESLKEPYTISLKFDKIIEGVNLSDSIYEEVIAEINGTYTDHYFASMYIMVRKLLENLLYDCLKAFYGTRDVEKYYNTNKDQHQNYGVLIDNFNLMIKESHFKKNVGDFEQKFIDLLKEFQETGNRNAHSLFNLAHQDFIEERKEKINNLIKKLGWIL